MIEALTLGRQLLAAVTELTAELAEHRRELARVRALRELANAEGRRDG